MCDQLMVNSLCAPVNRAGNAMKLVNRLKDCRDLLDDD